MQQLLIGGMADIDVEDWKKHTDYRGYNPSDEVVGWFWQCGEFDSPVSSFSLSLLSSFLSSPTTNSR